MAAFDGEPPGWVKMWPSHWHGMSSALGSLWPLRHQVPSVQQEVALAPACKEPKTLHGGPSPAKQPCDESIGAVHLPPAVDPDFLFGIKCLAPKPELRPWIFFPFGPP